MLSTVALSLVDALEERIVGAEDGNLGGLDAGGSYQLLGPVLRVGVEDLQDRSSWPRKRTAAVRCRRLMRVTFSMRSASMRLRSRGGVLGSFQTAGKSVARLPNPVRLHRCTQRGTLDWPPQRPCWVSMALLDIEPRPLC